MCERADTVFVLQRHETLRDLSGNVVREQSFQAGAFKNDAESAISKMEKYQDEYPPPSLMYHEVEIRWSWDELVVY